MIPSTSPEEPLTGPTCGPRYVICNAVRVHRRFIWVICAGISLLSARHLLVEQNIHYPLQLYFNHIVIVGFIALRSSKWQGTQRLFRERSQPWWPMTRGSILLTASLCFASLSTICTLQAILHVQNPPTLVMMILIAFFAESLSLFIIRGETHRYAELLRIGLLATAGAGLLLTDHRITVQSLAASIPAMLFAGVARALWRTAIRYHPDVLAKGTDQTGRYVFIGALVGVTWVLVFWKGDPIFALDSTNVPLFIMNALSSGFALALGKSMLLPIDDEVADTFSQTVDAPVHYIWDASTLVTLTGIVGCYSTLSVRRSYTSVYQFFCFLVAIICIEIRAQVDAYKAQPHSAWISQSAYELDSSLSEGSDAEEVNHSRKPALPSSLRNKTFRRLLLGITVISLWTAFGTFNAAEQPKDHNPVLLDRDYKPQLPVEIVLSMYNEPIDEVVEIIHNLRGMPSLSDAQVTIYTKNSSADNGFIKQRTGANHIIPLPNVGREGETYLNHILKRWDSLAHQTIFLQAGIHNPREFYTHVRNYYSHTQTGFLNLGWSGTVCNCADCGDRLFWTDSTHVLPQLYAHMYNTTPTACENVLLSYKGQFIVSAARVRGISKNVYNTLWQAFVDENSWAHQQGYLQGRPDSMSAPDFGYTMERMWNLLFQCSNREVAWKCPSLVSGWRIGGNTCDCQCFDK
ncbi:hypothetical protein P171DRAFT_237000 [Karstenula rhodostoma CBS 690.94]|uniref:Uncharacterized protein n=1 Tax=Karstenula rhodostoma CBS 690.94 TaxID=1392251 RepID=A0A9P4PRJ6_9PLEO|nr:hypothetical protein P171DRAFT_237000 [Karstenula rhodostoma CBS 690.94]